MSGWQSKPIGDAFRVVNGGTPKTGVSEYWDGPHCWITPAEMGGLSSPFVSASRRSLTDEGLRVGAELIPANSIILSTRAPIGHLVINLVPMAFNQGCKGLVPSSDIDTKFAYYFLLANVPLLESLGTGATFKELSGGKLKEVLFRFPALPEQHRVVAILDEAFEGIATAKFNAEKNLQNARELLGEVIQSALRDAPPAWARTSIGDQVTLQRGFDITKDQQREGAVPVVSSGGIKSFHDTPMARAPGVVMGRKGTLGKVFFLEEDYWPHDTTLWIKDFKGNDPRFVFHFFSVLEVHGLDSGAANPALNRNQVHALPVAWPPLPAQRAIADRCSELSFQAAQLSGIYERKVRALDELKKCVLHQAFNGAV